MLIEEFKIFYDAIKAYPGKDLKDKYNQKFAAILVADDDENDLLSERISNVLYYICRLDPYFITVGNDELVDYLEMLSRAINDEHYLQIDDYINRCIPW